MYSTCSMNPIENEAVIQTALDILGDYVELVDFEIKGINMSDGLNTWKIHVKQGKKSEYLSEFDKNMKHPYYETFFPNNKHNL